MFFKGLGFQVPSFGAASRSTWIVRGISRIRRKPFLGYAVALVAVAIATAGRFMLGEKIAVPFIMYFPAILLTVLVGGLGPAIVAIVASSVLAWYLFLAPPFSFNIAFPEAAALMLFVAVSGVMVAVVALLNASIDRVLEWEANYRILLESAPGGFVVVDHQGRIRFVNTTAEKLFGYSRAELIGRDVDILVPDRHATSHRMQRMQYQQSPETRPMGAGRDLFGRRKDGSEFSVEIGLNPLEGHHAVVATIIDISERKRAQDRQQLLIRELRHRSQNLFAVIQSVVRRSLSDEYSIAEAREVLSGRLSAVARAHSLLAESAWEGALLGAILRHEIGGFVNQIDVRCCDIVVNNLAAQQFALIVHELTTNAIKYGALSSPRGRISIEGRLERADDDSDSVFVFVWKESGGPPVAAPVRKGFGSVILLDSSRQFSKDVSLAYEVQGVNYQLRVPLRTIEVAHARMDAASSVDLAS